MDLVLYFLAFAITIIAQIFVSSTTNKYFKKKSKSGLTGSEVAKIILDQNGLSNVKVNRSTGNLTDHYDLAHKTVNLSSAVYDSDSITSISVAAHECGHAIQDKNGYTPLRIRHALIPLVNFSSYAGYFAIVIGAIASLTKLITIGLILECVILLFELVTLSVEFNASFRALKELEKNMIDTKEIKGSKKVLCAAAFTYVASTASTALEILRLVLIFGKRDDN